LTGEIGVEFCCDAEIPYEEPCGPDHHTGTWRYVFVVYNPPAGNGCLNCVAYINPTGCTTVEMVGQGSIPFPWQTCGISLLTINGVAQTLPPHGGTGYDGPQAASGSVEVTVPQDLISLEVVVETTCGERRVCTASSRCFQWNTIRVEVPSLDMNDTCEKLYAPPACWNLPIAPGSFCNYAPEYKIQQDWPAVIGGTYFLGTCPAWAWVLTAPPGYEGAQGSIVPYIQIGTGSFSILERTVQLTKNSNGVVSSYTQEDTTTGTATYWLMANHPLQQNVFGSYVSTPAVAWRVTAFLTNMVYTRKIWTQPGNGYSEQVFNVAGPYSIPLAAPVGYNLLDPPNSILGCEGPVGNAESLLFKWETMGTLKANRYLWHSSPYPNMFPSPWGACSVPWPDGGDLGDYAVELVRL
jgi:hypothetical protein